MEGEIFKDIRKGKGLSLEFVSAGISSSTSLSEFELGHRDIPLRKLVKMLNKMDISISEYALAIDKKLNRNDKFLELLAQNYSQNNPFKIKKQALENLKIYRSTDSKYEFFNYMMAANFYSDLTGKRLASKEDVSRLQNIMFDTQRWGIREIQVFGNTLILMNNELIFSLCQELLEKMEDISSNYLLAVDAWNAIFNAFQVLIIRGSEKARLLNKRLAIMEFPESLPLISYQLSFLQDILKFKTTSDAYIKDRLDQSIEHLKERNCSKLASRLSNILASISD
ncbi:Rgg/GadR/MutR family transcriptional regulator [Rummeliibacillus suwonensis]|uniref:Rgg/GadR/MutR family transcriptional regulator n=1 Tax=Rummeliibacillus suwonensis TaxID=1306154 RepID=UPI001AAE46AC|nr:Rgg/GadR/MutR family transcriptional regulator [Rummeliibacillus suwonensis]MBO2535614.1 hypothetical protein [Rummeliibacillus suwonensis]